MTPQEVKDIANTLKNSTQNQLIVYGIIITLIYIGGILYQYFQARSIASATKKDIGELTRLAKTVESQIKALEDTEKIKYTLKYNALLKSLKLVDAYTSTHWLPSPDFPIMAQYAEIEEFRDCQNEIILTCDNNELVNHFYKLMFPTSNIIGEQMKNLTAYRNFIRAELGFGKPLSIYTDTVWFASIGTQKPKSDN